jgi:hypothetical protein
VQELASKISLYIDHPSAMVEEMFGATPDAWQHQVFEAFPHNPMIAMQSCTGSGKTMTLAMLGLNVLITRPHPIIGATAINKANLESNLWTELNRWYYKSTYLQKHFEIQATEIHAREYPDTWKLEKRTWAKDANAEQVGNALRGLHADYVMWLADEMGSAAAAILPTMEAIFSGSPKEAHIVMAGNPTTRAGVLYRACVTNRKHWFVVEITADPDSPIRTPRVSIEHAKRQIEEWGRDNPWVIVNIFGRFPPSDINALISEDEILAAMKRSYRQHELDSSARVMGIDVARDGANFSCIAKRQGLQVWPFKRARSMTSTQGASWVQRDWVEWQADAAFIDATGGFGAGWLDQLIQLKRQPVGVKFSEAAHDKGQYYNKRAEMYFDAISWIKRGGAIPPDAYGLLTALPAITYTFKGERILLEEKEQVVERLGNIPHVDGCMDESDAFALTFSEPVVRPQAPTAWRPPSHLAAGEYNPFAGMEVKPDRW